MNKRFFLDTGQNGEIKFQCVSSHFGRKESKEADELARLAKKREQKQL